MALPLRRNSGPESEFKKMFGKKSKSSKFDSLQGQSSHYSLRIEQKKKEMLEYNNQSAEYLSKNTSSSESLDNIISSQKLKSRKGHSLDRSVLTLDIEPNLPAKPKRSSWFLREKRDKQMNKRNSLDITSTYDTGLGPKSLIKNKQIQRQNASDFTGYNDSSSTQPEDIDFKKGISKFQIGKRFLKGEIGIKSFNYYLLKESLKKINASNLSNKPTENPNKMKPSFMSKSDENIYEEIFFQNQSQHNRKESPPKQPPPLPPLTHQFSLKHRKKEIESCMNCEICQHEQQQSICQAQNCETCVKIKRNCVFDPKQQNKHDASYGQITQTAEDVIYDFFQKQQGQHVLQFQSYNPNNPQVRFLDKQIFF